MNPTILTLAPFALIGLLFLIATARMTYKRRQLHAGTVPNNFPPESVLPVGQIQTGNKLGATATFTTAVFFTAPTSGWYLLSWAVHINSTDGAGTLTATFTPPHSVAIPGVQAAPATGKDGAGPAAPYFMAGGETVTGAVAAAGVTGTNFDTYLFAQRLF